MNRSSRRHATSFLKKSCLSVLVVFALTANASAQEPTQQTVQYEIAAGDLVQVVNEISRSSGVQIVYDIELLRGKRAAEVSGTMTLEQALGRVLSGSGLVWERANATTLVIKMDAKADHSQSPPKAFHGKKAEDGTSSAETTKDLEKLVVVGSRLGALPTDSALPVKVINRDEIERSGASSISQVLSRLPEVSVSNAPDGNIGPAGSIDGVDINATSVQLRGLPLGTTLILINGRRAGESSAFASTGLFDLSTIPLAMVDRIEVLPAGASAIYGGDGLAGVINIVLKQNADGSEIRVRHLSADGYYEDQVSVLWGKSWSRGSLLAMAAWGRNDTLKNSERRLTENHDFTRYGGVDRRLSTYSYPANVYSLDGCPEGMPFCLIPLDERGNLPGTGSPYATVPSGQDGAGLSTDDFEHTSGIISRETPELKFKNAEKDQSLLLSGSFQILKDTEVSAELVHNKRSIPARELVLWTSGGEYGISGAIASKDNPFNPFGVDVGIDYWYSNTGIFSSFSQSHQRLAVGAKGRWQSWYWDFSGSRTRDRSILDGPGGFDQYLVGAALLSANPDTALNVFTGDGSAPGTRDMLTTLISTTERNYGSDSHDISAFVRGPLLKLPAGDLHALIGGEYRKVKLLNVNDGIAGIEGKDASRAIYAEVRAPIVSAQKKGDNNELMAITGAIRNESLGRSNEDATTSTVGFEFWPFKSFLIRGTYSTAFKPILTYDAVRSVEIWPFPVQLQDPAFGGQEFPVQLLMGGGTPADLKPETSTSKTFGFVYAPGGSFRASLSAWETNFRDKFEYLQLYQAQLLLNHESSFQGRIKRNPESGVVEQIDARMINVSSTKISGIDVAIDGRWSTSIGQIESSLAATHTHGYRTKLFPESPSESKLAILSSTGWAPKWKITPRLSWFHEDYLSASLMGRYISKYKDTFPLASGANQGELLTLGDYWVLDFSADIGLDRWSRGMGPWFSGTRLRLNVNNVTDRLPDFCNSCAYGYDATQYDIFGRTASVELILGF